MSSKSSSFSVKDKRSLSSFLTHELLYDYLMGSLDEERSLAVKKSLDISKESKSDIQKMQAGLEYLNSLRQVQVNTQVVEELASSTGYIPMLLQKSRFHSWPTGVKWGLEALVVVFAIAMVLTLSPWEKILNYGSGLGDREVVLAEIEKSKITTPIVEGPPEFIDEGVKEGELAASATPASPQPSQAKVEAVVVKTPEKPAAKASTKATHPAPESGGFLYRGEVAITNIDVVGPKITDKIIQLGGRKAGSVELGWKRTPNSIYYHFTIPAAKYNDILSFLEAYGQPKINKEKHTRVMKDGIIRLIITVDEAKQ